MSTETVPVTVTAVPAPLRESLSPFVEWSEADRAPLPEELLHQPERRSLATELLRSPEAVIGQLADLRGTQRLITGAVGWIALGAVSFVLLQETNRSPTAQVHAAVLMAINLLAAVAATLGPVYGTSLLHNTRIPMTRLIATMLAATATGTLLLGALAPLLRVLFNHDELWGATAMAGSFLLAGGVAGRRIHRLLLAQAESISGGTLAKDDAYRVGIVARMAFVMLALSTVLVFRGVYLFGE